MRILSFLAILSFDEETAFGEEGHDKPEVAPFIDRISKWTGAIGAGSAFIASIAIALMLLLTVSDIGRRYIFGSSINGAYEVVSLFLTIVFFIAPAYTQWKKGHLRLELLTSRLPLRVALFLETVFFLLAFGFFVILLWSFSKEAMISLKGREFSIGLISFPIYPAKLIAAFGILLLCLMLAGDILRNMALFVHPRGGKR